MDHTYEEIRNVVIDILADEDCRIQHAGILAALPAKFLKSIQHQLVTPLVAKCLPGHTHGKPELIEP